MIEILKLPLGPLQTNCYFVGCDETMTAAVIDPAWGGRSIAATAEEQGYEITHILLTHAHFDHVGGLAELKATTEAPIYIHADAVPMLEQAGMSAAFMNVKIANPPPPDEMLEEGQIINVGYLELEVMHTPGHAPGHVSFYIPKYHVLLSGDVLFQGSIGRTDLPGGDEKLLLQTIKNKLMPLPYDTHVLSGHGHATTIGQEKDNNPYLR